MRGWWNPDLPVEYLSAGMVEVRKSHGQVSSRCVLTGSQISTYRPHPLLS